MNQKVTPTNEATLIGTRWKNTYTQKILICTHTSNGEDGPIAWFKDRYGEPCGGCSLPMRLHPEMLRVP